MSLIKCPECQKEISDQAISCPNCGYSRRKTEHMTFDVVSRGAYYDGKRELDSLLSKGWEIIDCDDNDTWVADGYECRLYRYNLKRDTFIK